ncbi:MAG TPA: hypothetical protein PKI32_00160, partial [Opitutales bacterium]|nr:hypothetical protein [Opitutales bacterium]
VTGCRLPQLSHESPSVSIHAGSPRGHCQQQAGISERSKAGGLVQGLPGRDEHAYPYGQGGVLSAFW